MVKALSYKLEGHGVDSLRCHWNFSLTSFRPHFGPGVNLVCNKNEYQEYLLVGKGGRCIGLTTWSPLCADCPEVWQPQPHGNPQGLSRPVQGLQKNTCFVNLHTPPRVSPHSGYFIKRHCNVIMCVRNRVTSCTRKYEICNAQTPHSFFVS